MYLGAKLQEKEINNYSCRRCGPDARGTSFVPKRNLQSVHFTLCIKATRAIARRCAILRNYLVYGKRTYDNLNSPTATRIVFILRYWYLDCLIFFYHKLDGFAKQHTPVPDKKNLANLSSTETYVTSCRKIHCTLNRQGGNTCFIKLLVEAQRTKELSKYQYEPSFSFNIHYEVLA